MIWYCAFLLAAGFASAIPSQKLHPFSDEFIQEINNKQSTWQAGRNFEIEEYELFKILASGVKETNNPNILMTIHNEDEEVPDSFDAREAWPECADIIGLIRDQSRCGACWAFAAVEAMSDRICIHSNATRKLLVSAQDLLACGYVAGCTGGGPLDGAWGTWKQPGLVTGGLYNHSEQGCSSYYLPPCDDHLKNCRDYVDMPTCVKECDDPSLNYKDQKTYGLDVIRVRGEKQVQLEILKNGPVEAGFTVYADFGDYKSGIYQHTTEEVIGGHAVKIIGWGIENDIKYWIIANSWNERWGDNGFFKLLRGQDEAGIERSSYAALPDFSRF